MELPWVETRSMNTEAGVVVGMCQQGSNCSCTWLLTDHTGMPAQIGRANTTAGLLARVILRQICLVGITVKPAEKVP
jgi:hypothetical protein